MADRPQRIEDGLIPLGPLDTYNGIPVVQLCNECRSGIARVEHRMRASFELCAACRAQVLGLGVIFGAAITLIDDDPPPQR